MDSSLRGRPLETQRDCTFLVLPGGDCVPVDGPYEIQEHRGDFFVLGQSSWELWPTRAEAERRLEQQICARDPHDSAVLTLELGLDGEFWILDEDAESF